MIPPCLTTAHIHIKIRNDNPPLAEMISLLTMVSASFLILYAYYGFQCAFSPGI